MTDKPSRTGVEMQFAWGRAPRLSRPRQDAPFYILVIGDFSGRGAQPNPLPPRPIRVDIDTFDQLFERLAPAVALEIPGAASLEIPIRELDHFHPDHLFNTLPWFAEVRQLRSALGNAATFAQAAAQLGLGPAAAPAPAAASQQPPPDDMFQQLLGRPSASKPAAAHRSEGGLDSLIRRLVAPHVVHGPDPRQADAIRLVDQVTEDLMRAILHHPDFQAMEAAWRGLDYLVRNVDSDGAVKIEVLDLSKTQLAADLDAAADMNASALYRTIVDARSGASGLPPYALLVGHFHVAPDPVDIQLMQKLAAIAAAAGAPLVTAADLAAWSRLADDPAHAARSAWSALRQHPSASALGLCTSGFLLRLPYGKGAEQAERFRFEEMPPSPEPSRYLWGNAALLLASVLAQGFESDGWEMDVDAGTEVAGLPVHWTKQNGDTVQTPCAQEWISAARQDQLLALGLTPWIPVRGRDAVRLPRLQSVSSPATRLAGKWGA